ncbi:hypothetical protein FKM82_015959 [Ascaphus truei]
MSIDIIRHTIEWTVSLSAVIGNMFILGVNILDWTKNKRLSSSDQIIFGLSVLNILQRTLKICSYFIPEHLHLIGTAFSVSFMAVIYCNLWFSNWLCVHYCLKIVNMNQRFYIDLQRKFHKMLPWLLILSTLVSCLISLSVALDFQVPFSPNTTDATVDLFFQKNCKLCCTIPIYVATSSLAFLMSSSSVFAILISLRRHMKRMRQSSDGFRMGPPVRAAETLTSLLVINIVFFLTLVILIYKDKEATWKNIVNISLAFYPVLSSMVLIRGNIKLKKTFARILCCFSCTRAANILTIG